MEVRLASSNGCLSWNGAPLFVATALAREYVAFEEVDDGIWTLRFANVSLARYDERHCRFHHMAPFTEGGSAASPPRA